MIFVTGGAGFIGSQFVREWVRRYPSERLLNFDLLTYAGNLDNLAELPASANTQFVRGDICDAEAIDRALPEGCDAVVHFAAESHVDRSILSAAEFVRTNVLGTQVLLDAARAKKVKRFLHISTDEVGGSIEHGLFAEDDRLAPSSPYAASKAGAEHLVRAAYHTFGFPALITRTSNNYGPFQFPEKLLPLAISKALANEPIPVYGDGLQVRDWIHVADNCDAILEVLQRGRDGEIYHVGGGNRLPNIELLRILLRQLGKSESLLRHVTDRLGHDRRYAVDCSKIERELGWRPRISFEAGMEQTVEWYATHSQWVARAKSGKYRIVEQQIYNA